MKDKFKTIWFSSPLSLLEELVPRSTMEAITIQCVSRIKINFVCPIIIYHHNNTQPRLILQTANFDPTLLQKMSGTLRKFTKSQFFRYGLPFFSLLVIGSFGLSEFTSIVVAKREKRSRMLTSEEALSYGKKVEKVDVEEEYEKTMKELDIDNWRNKRGPRPWEEQKE